jgi:hypothetical protein
MKGFKEIKEIGDETFYLITNLGHEFYLLVENGYFTVQNIGDEFDFIDGEIRKHKVLKKAFEYALMVSAIEILDIEQVA